MVYCVSNTFQDQYTLNACLIFFSALTLYANCHNFSEPVLQNLVNTKCNPYLLYGSEVIEWNNSELSSVSYSLNCAMCRVGLYKIDFHFLSTAYYYTRQSEIVQDVRNSQRTFLHKCSFVSNSIVKLLADRRY